MIIRAGKSRAGCHFKSWFVKGFYNTKGNNGAFAKRLKEDTKFPITKDKTRILNYIKEHENQYDVLFDTALLCKYWNIYQNECDIKDAINKFKRLDTEYDSILNSIDSDITIESLCNKNSKVIEILKNSGCSILFAGVDYSKCVNSNGFGYHIRGNINDDWMDYFKTDERHIYSYTICMNSLVYFLSRDHSPSDDTLCFRAYLEEDNRWNLCPLHVPENMKVRHIDIINKNGKRECGAFLIKESAILV